MKMTAEEYSHELPYQMTMMYFRGMLKEGLITEEEYRVIDTKMCEKYLPITGGTCREISLLCVEDRANMVVERSE